MDDDRYLQIMEPVGRPVMLEDRFRFTPHARFHWLQRLMFWTLAKLGCNAWDEEMTVLTFRPRDVLDAIRKQRLAALKWDPRDGELEMVIGADDFQELMGTPEFRYSFAFSVAAKPSEKVMRTFMGMRVRVVPWIKGVVIYPTRIASYA